MEEQSNPAYQQFKLGAESNMITNLLFKLLLCPKTPLLGIYIIISIYPALTAEYVPELPCLFEIRAAVQNSIRPRPMGHRSLRGVSKYSTDKHRSQTSQKGEHCPRTPIPLGLLPAAPKWRRVTFALRRPVNCRDDLSVSSGMLHCSHVHTA